jgi:hypothetical protein
MEIRLGGNKGLSTFVDDEDYRTFNLGSYNWYPSGKYGSEYAKTYKNGKQMSLHRLIMGLENGPTSVLVDHIDHNGLNNCRDNLRKTDIVGNGRNSRKQLSATSSRYKGVNWNWANNRIKPWNAYITLSDRRKTGTDNKTKGRQKNLGNYRTQEEAATAYNKAATELFGPMACLNILPD